MKARDVVAGWPRGRSTTAAGPWSIKAGIAYHTASPAERMDTMAMLWALPDWSVGDCTQLALDYWRDFLYHEKQQAMVWRGWEDYRQPVVLHAWRGRDWLSAYPFRLGNVIMTEGE